MKHNYTHLIEYFKNNEYDTFSDQTKKQLEDVINDTYNEDNILEIIDALNDEYMLSDFETGLIKDMFVYYTTHKK